MYQSHVETGRSGVSEDRIRRLASYCACDDPAHVDALVAMAAERGKGWWEKYRGIVGPGGLDLAEAEHHAVHIQTFQMAHIPGLLQTEDYSRALFHAGTPNLRPKDMEAITAFRLRRQHVITESPTTPYEAVIHEAALRLLVSDRKTSHAQLRKILDMSELPNVTVRVVPFATENFAGVGLSMLYLHGPTPQLDTLQIDTGHGSAFFDAEPLLKRRRKRYALVVEASLPPADSMDFIAQVLREL